MKRRSFCIAVFFVFLLACSATAGAKSALVFQTDFGLRDGAVASMKGVAFGVDAGLAMFDLTHDIPEYSVWDAAYRLRQTMPFWPAGTVFVSVVDPGSSSSRRTTGR